MKMKRISGKAAGVLVAAVMLLAGCKQQADEAQPSKTVSASEVAVPESVSKENYAAPTEADKDKISAAIKNELKDPSALVDAVKNAFGGISIQGNERSVSVTDLSTEIKEAMEKMSEEVMKMSEKFRKGENAEYEFSFDKSYGDVTGLPSGLNLNLNRGRYFISSKYEFGEDKTSYTGTSKTEYYIDADGSVDLTVLAPSASSIFKSATVKALGSSSQDGSVVFDIKDMSSAGYNSLKANSNVDAGLGAVFVTEDGIAGKLVGKAEMSMSADLSAEKAKEFYKKLNEANADEEKMVALILEYYPLSVKLTVDVYTLDGKFVFNYVTVSDPKKLYEFIKLFTASSK